MKYPEPDEDVKYLYRVSSRSVHASYVYPKSEGIQSWVVTWGEPEQMNRFAEYLNTRYSVSTLPSVEQLRFIWKVYNANPVTPEGVDD